MRALRFTWQTIAAVVVTCCEAITTAALYVWHTLGDVVWELRFRLHARIERREYRHRAVMAQLAEVRSFQSWFVDQLGDHEADQYETLMLVRDLTHDVEAVRKVIGHGTTDRPSRPVTPDLYDWHGTDGAA